MTPWQNCQRKVQMIAFCSAQTEVHWVSYDLTYLFSLFLVFSANVDAEESAGGWPAALLWPWFISEWLSPSSWALTAHTVAVELQSDVTGQIWANKCDWFICIAALFLSPNIFCCLTYGWRITRCQTHLTPLADICIIISAVTSRVNLRIHFHLPAVFIWKLCLNRGNAIQKSACGKYVQNTALV